jgi:hypothetical protein
MMYHPHKLMITMYIPYHIFLLCVLSVLIAGEFKNDDPIGIGCLIHFDEKLLSQQNASEQINK